MWPMLNAYTPGRRCRSVVVRYRFVALGEGLTVQVGGLSKGIYYPGYPRLTDLIFLVIPAGKHLGVHLENTSITLPSTPLKQPPY